MSVGLFLLISGLGLVVTVDRAADPREEGMHLH